MVAASTPSLMTPISLGWVEALFPSMQGMSSWGTLALGRSTVKLSCLSSGFPVFSRSSSTFFRLPSSSFFSICLVWAPWWPTLLWILGGVGLFPLDRSTSVQAEVIPETLCPVLVIRLSFSTFSWSSRSCFSDEETFCLDWLRVPSGASGSIAESSEGSCGRVLLLRSDALI